MTAVRTLPAAGVLLASVLIGTGCRSMRGDAVLARAGATLTARQNRLSQNLARAADSGANREAPVARWVLPRELSEISGLALTADGRLLAHDDELGQVFEIDYRRGLIVKQFVLGEGTLHEDFEAMTVAGDRIFMLVSNGKVFEFREGKNGDRVTYKVHDTKLRHACEFEGLAFDPKANALVLACKHVLIKSLKEFVVLYRWNLDDRNESAIAQVRVPLAEVVGENGWKRFNPSDITVDPATGNYVIIAAQQQGMLVLTPDGAVVSSHRLPDKHVMAEGVAITQDSILIVSDEAMHGPATITLFRWS